MLPTNGNSFCEDVARRNHQDRQKELGAAYAAGLAVGFYKNTDDLRSRWSVGQTWNPSLDEPKRAEMYRLWKKAVTRSFDWTE